MKDVSLTINQLTEELDLNGLDAALKVAQGKIKSLGLEQFDEASLSFRIGPTTVEFSSATMPNPAEVNALPED